MAIRLDPGVDQVEQAKDVEQSGDEDQQQPRVIPVGDILVILHAGETAQCQICGGFEKGEDRCSATPCTGPEEIGVKEARSSLEVR